MKNFAGECVLLKTECNQPNINKGTFVPTKTKKNMKTTKQQCQDLYDKIYDAFHSQSGGEYNDTMWVQWQGASDEMFEADEDGSWDYALKNLKKCWNYVKVCKKIDELKSNMPDAIYC